MAQGPSTVLALAGGLTGEEVPELSRIVAETRRPVISISRGCWPPIGRECRSCGSSRPTEQSLRASRLTWLFRWAMLPTQLTDGLGTIGATLTSQTDLAPSRTAIATRAERELAAEVRKLTTRLSEIWSIRRSGTCQQEFIQTFVG